MSFNVPCQSEASFRACVCGVQADWGAQEAAGSNAADCDTRGNVVFKGARARVGMFHGEVVKIVPHSRTG
jgi:hypothetical protein